MELPKRKPTRLKGYDYSASGMYFLTVCIKNRVIRQMSEYGEILDKHIRLADEKYSHIKIDKYVIMPNHFHLILNITDYKSGASETVFSVIR